MKFPSILIFLFLFIQCSVKTKIAETNNENYKLDTLTYLDQSTEKFRLQFINLKILKLQTKFQLYLAMVMAKTTEAII